MSVTGGARVGLSGGWLQDATLTLDEGQTLHVDGVGTLSNVTLNSDLDLTRYSGVGVNIMNGLTLNGTAYLGTTDGSTYGVMRFDGTQTIGGTGNIVFGGVFANALVIATPSTTVTLSPNVTVHGISGFLYPQYSDSSFVNQGTIASDSGGRIDVGGWPGYVNNDAGSLVSQGTLSASNTGLLFVHPIAWSSTGTISSTSGGEVRLLSGGSSGVITANGGTVNFDGTWSNSAIPTLAGGILNLRGNGTWSAAGIQADAASVANLYGSVTTGGGALDVLGGLFHVWSGTLVNGTMNVSASGQLQFSGGTLDNFTIANHGHGTWTSGNVTFTNGAAFNNAGTFDDQTDGTFGGDGITCPEFTNTGSFVKSGGSGTTDLKMDFFNSGTVEIQNGTLNVSCGYVQTGGSTVATGGGSVVGTVEIQAGSVQGNVPADYSVSGSLDVSPSLDPVVPSSSYKQTAAGILNEQIGGVSAGTQYGQIVVAGNVILDGTLRVTLFNGFAPRIGDQFTIINNEGGHGVTGTFAGLPEGSTLWAGAYGYTISYQGGDGNDVTLTVSHAPTAVWDGASDGDGDGTSWNDPFNWAGDIVPGSNDDVIIDLGNNAFTVSYKSGTTSIKSLTSRAKLSITGGDLSIAENSQLFADLTISNATVSGAGDITVSGPLTISNGEWAGTGVLTANGVTTIDRIYLSGTLVANGDTTWSSGEFLAYSGPGTFINNGTFEITGDGSMLARWGYPGSFINEGQVIKTGGAGYTSIEEWQMTNHGTIDVRSGTLYLSGTSSGSIHGDAGTTLVFDGGFTELSGSLDAATVIFSGASSNYVQITGSYNATSTAVYGINATFSGPITAVGDLNISGTAEFTPSVGGPVAITIPSLHLTGTLITADDLTVSGAMDWNGGVLQGVSGKGSLAVQSDMTLDGTYYVRDFHLINVGDAVWSGGTLRFFGNSIFTNALGATLDIQVDSTFGSFDNQVIRFNNDGTLVKSANNGVTYLNAILYNRGTVRIEQGQIYLSAGYVQTTPSPTPPGIILPPGEDPGFDDPHETPLPPATQPPPIFSTYNQEVTGVLIEQIAAHSPPAEFGLPGIDYGALTISRSVSLAGSLQIQLLNGFLPNPGDKFLVINNLGSNPVVGSFANLPEGTVIPIGNYGFVISYVGGTGNDVVLTAISINSPPVASVGGTYTVQEGQSLTLDASASYDPDHDPLTYTWTINGHRNAATGVNPVLTWSQLRTLGITDSSRIYDVQVTIDDGNGHFVDSSVTTLTGTDAPFTDTTPATTLNAMAGTNTGSVVLATFSDANPFADLTDYAASIDWGGTLRGTSSFAIEFVSRSATSSLWRVVGSAAYAARGNYTLTVAINDIDGSSTLQSRQTAFAVIGLTAVEGNSTGTVVLATFTDSNPNAPLSKFTSTVTWGGPLVGRATSAVQLVSRSATYSTWQVVGDATYSAAGSFTITATVKDSTGTLLHTSLTPILVDDAPLTDISLLQLLNVFEGNSTGPVVLATFTDGDPAANTSEYRAVVNWGAAVIGTPAVSFKLVSRTSTLSTWQVVGTATFAQPGTSTVSVTVNDIDGGSFQSDKTTVVVLDPPLTDTTSASTVSLYEGRNTGNVVLATFTDGNPKALLTDYTFSVDWGGAVIGTPKVTLQLISRSTTLSTWRIVGSTAYAEPGTYAPVVSIHDVDGGSISSNKITFDITEAPLTDTTPLKTFNALEGRTTGTIILATFSDGNPQALVTDFTPTVDWGGVTVNTSAVTVVLVSRSATVSNWRVVGSASYTQPGMYNVNVRVNDRDGASMTTTNTSVSVADAPLRDLSPNRTFNAVEGNSTGTIVLATFSDANPLTSVSDFANTTVSWNGPLIGDIPTYSVQLVSRSTTASIWQVVGSVTYAEKGLYSVTVVVNDVDGSTLQSTRTTFNVADAKLTDTSVSQTITAVSGTANTNVVLATFTDGNPWSTLADYTASVNWGGTLIGTPALSIVKNGSVWQIIADSVTYQSRGTYTITVLVTDIDGSTVQSRKTRFVVS